MADVSRQEKLAAARKKLKEYQKGRGSSPAPPRNSPRKQRQNLKASSVVIENGQSLSSASFTGSSSNFSHVTDNFQDNSGVSTEEGISSTVSSVGSSFHADSPVDGVTGNHSVQMDHSQDLTHTGVSETVLGADLHERSNTENLRQLSLQITGLVNEASSFVNGEIMSQEYQHSNTDLEHRNQELAALLDQERQTNQQFNFQINSLNDQVVRLETQLKEQQQHFESQVSRDIFPLKEQLQVHVQTIGILVAEKTELQSALTHSQNSAKQKAVEAEELSSQLKTSRHQITELEQEVSSLHLKVETTDSINGRLSADLEKLKLQQSKTSKQGEEASSELKELQQKLETQFKECQQLSEQLQKTKSALAMAELRAQQLSNSTDENLPQQLEILHEEKLSLERELSSARQSLHGMSVEREHYNQQMQQYSQQLATQLEHLNLQNTGLQKENSELLIKIKDLSQNTELGLTVQQKTELEETFRVRIEEVQQQHSNLEKQYNDQVEDNAQLSRLITEREEQIEEMEQRIENLEGRLSTVNSSRVDQQQLLDKMQSDKVAASRAMTQNKKLKEQLEELQKGFIQVTNSKLEVTEKYESEQQVSTELGERLAQQEEEISEIRSQLLQKDQIIKELQQNSKEQLKQEYHHMQISDRMRHYEAQGQVAEILQQELNQAKEHIQSLSNQNSELRTMLAHQVQDVVSNSSDNSAEVSKKDELLASLSTSVRQLELERNQLIAQLEEQKSQREILFQQFKDSRTDNATEPEDAQEHMMSTEELISTEDYQKLRSAMNKLEERFNRTMQDIANMSDEKQQLEHLVIQLQGETETIGEYISLYQMQRNVMRKRAREKDTQLAHLAREREELKVKLTELNELVTGLLGERYVVHESSKETPQVTQQKPAEKTTTEDSPDYESDHSEHQYVVQESNSGRPNTAKKIVDLLSEIRTSNLVESPPQENFHPCSVCSGRLLIV